MTMTQIIIIVAVAVVVVAVLLSRSGGPRVTHIDRTVRKDKDSGDA